MMKARMIQLPLGAALAVTLAAAACHFDGGYPSGPVETDSRSVHLGDAKSVQVEVHMGSGELNMGGGAKDLLDAEFSYQNPRWKPNVDYRVTAGRGHLTIRQPAGKWGPGGPGRYTWELRLKDDVPMELEVHLGAGKSDLALGSLALRKLDVHMGVGECIVDLAGDWKEDLRASIKGGIGKATVRLPEDVGVKVRAKGGIGEIRRGPLKQQGDAFVNDAYGQSPVTLEVNVEGGIGEINLEVSEGPAVI
jgi:hypothetical protein